MKEIQIFANPNQESILRYVIDNNSMAYGFAIRTVHSFPHGEYKLFNVCIRDEQAAFALGLLYQKELNATHLV